jgi:tetratricopeptide (TPR) repeat protein
MGNEERDRLLQEGIAAARAGQKEQARNLLLQVIALDEEVEQAWLWLSGVVDDPEERQICLENVLALNPDNKAAQDGLRWLREQAVALAPEPPAAPPPQQLRSQRATLVPSAAAAAPSAGVESRLPETRPVSPERAVTVEIDPFGCPYCGGPVSGEESRCDHCRRLVFLRHRKREAGMELVWLVLMFLLLGAVAWLEGYLGSQLVEAGQLPQWLSRTALSLVIGPALFGAEGVGELARFSDAVKLVNYGLTGLCVLAAVGLALRFRLAYFASFLLAGFMVVVTLAALLARLTGWIPALLRLGMVALSVKWLVDAAPLFEWDTRYYNADTDQGLKNDLDYHNRALQYYGQRMWAKAASHWKVAAQLAPGQVQYRADLANAYLRLGYPEAALAEVDKAIDRVPEDEELRAFRSSLVALAREESP